MEALVVDWRLRSHARSILIWTVLFGLFYATYLLQIEQVPASDLTQQFHAFALFQARALKAGHFPLWSTGSYGGFPFAGDIQSAVFYPPRLLTIFLTIPLNTFPLIALVLEGLAHIWLAGVGAYALAYHITRRQSAALFAAVGFGLGGYLTSYPLLQLAVLETIAWLPWVLLCIRIGTSTQDPLKWLIGTGFLLGLSGLAGHPQTFLQAAYLAGVYYLFCTVRARWHFRPILTLGLVWSSIGISIFSMAAAPTIRYAQTTSRADVSYEFVSSGQPLNDLIQVLIPSHFSLWQVNYYGLATLILVLLAWRLRNRAVNRSEIVFWAAVAIIGSWLALGDAGVLFALAHRFAPGVGLFRQQERWMNLVALAMPILAANGYALWIALPSVQQRLMVKTVARWLLIAFGAVGLLLIGMRAILDVDVALTFAQQAGLCGLTLVFFWWRLIPRAVLPLLLLGLLSADLYFNTLDSVGRIPATGELTWPRYEWMDTFETDDPGRLESRMAFWANAGEIHGWEDLSGISPLKFNALGEFERIPDKRRWQLLNVTHIVAAHPLNERTEPIAKIDNSVRPNEPLDTSLLRYTNQLGRAWLVYDTITVENETAAFDLLRDSAEFNPATTAVLHTSPANLVTVQPPATPSTVMTTRDYNRLDIKTQSDTAGVLVVSNWFYPGWQATIDGTAVETFAVNAAQIGLVVPAGSHEVALRFRPNDLFVGVLIAVVTLICALILPRAWQPTIAKQHWQLRFPSRPADFTNRLLAIWPAALTTKRMSILLLLTGFWLRLRQLSTAEYDQIEAAILLGEGNSQLLWDTLLSGWIVLIGSAEFTTRILSLLLAVLLLALLKAVAHRVAGAPFALMVLTLAAISQPLIQLGSRIDGGITLALILTLCITTLLFGPMTYRRAIVLVLGSVGLALTHRLGIVFIAALLPYFWQVRQRQTQPRRRAILWLLSTLLGLWFIVATTPTSNAAYQNLAEAIGNIVFTVGSGWFNGPSAWRWLWIASIIPIWQGGQTLRQRAPQTAVLFIGWLVGGVVLLVILPLADASFDPFDALLVAPPWWILYAYGVFALWRQRQLVTQILAGAFVLLPLGAFVVLNFTSTVAPALVTRSWRDSAETVAKQHITNEVIVADTTDAAQRYYFDPLGVPFVVLGQDHGAAEESVRNLATAYDRIWYLTTVRPSWDLAGLPHRWLESNTLREQAQLHTQPNLFAYRPSDALDNAIRPIGSQSADGKIQLDGIHITQNGVWLDPVDQMRLQPNGELNVTLVWSAREGISADYTTYVHLFNTDGVLIAQHDGIPSFGNRRTQNWPVDEPIIDPHLLTLTNLQPGIYDLIISMYDSSTVEQLPFENGFAGFAWRIFLIIE